MSAPIESVVMVRGVRLRRHTERGPRGGVRHTYQSADASVVWGYWYSTASQAIRESNASDRVVRS